MTAVRPPGRYGALDLDGPKVNRFRRKAPGDNILINGGFFVLSAIGARSSLPATDVWEQDPLEQLAHDGELMAYRHNGFWQPMDTLRDKNVLEELWQTGQAPWKIWH